MVEKLKIALALQPLATALFANSPFKNGEPTGNLSERSLVWLDTDPDRTGMLPMVFEPGSALNTMSITRSMRQCILCSAMGVINALGMSFRDFWKDAASLAG